ncbi:hypothetical protein TanjilG_05087 [Lupinus angustifolius]|uniref:MADS-box domain-containing protein n=1 Tax=Lupinus angustifolius TaxID=3871 RepID=A0A4P1R5U3_LUPAN|nr:PREDICTED: agamous-like MADS-box protein AGL62 [Lupinus angustifolius]OIW02494.1 hypothetical protein TanjilG_05087 [Lupinus angustifolius]
MASSSKKNIATTTIQHNKRKIEKLEPNTNKFHVTFSKRKLGLFNKVTEISILCQAETALILSSQQGNLYACGYPGPDVVIRRFLTNGSPVQHSRTSKKEQQEFVETLRLEFEAAHNKLKEEKKRLDEIREAHNGRLDLTPWWNQDIEKMGLEDLEHFITSLETLKLNLVATAEAKKINPMSHMVMTNAIGPSPRFSNSSLMNGYFTGNHQAWNWMGSSSSSNLTVPKFQPGYYIRHS